MDRLCLGRALLSVQGVSLKCYCCPVKRGLWGCFALGLISPTISLSQSRCVEDQIVGSRSTSIQDDVLSLSSDLSSLQDHAIGIRQGQPVPTGNGPAMNLTWIHPLPVLNPLLGQVDFNQMNSALGQNSLWPNVSSCGVVFFLQKVMPAQSCPPSMPSSGSGELPRCQSLPGVLAASSSGPRGTLGGLSLSLPHLSMSGEKLAGSEASVGTPVKCRSS